MRTPEPTSGAALGLPASAASATRRGTWARGQGLVVPPTGRIGAQVLEAWRNAGAPEAADQAGAPVTTGERQFEQARTALSALCTAAVEEGYLAEHPVRIRPGTKGRSRSRSS